jgi:hypothetical protein
MTDPVLTLRQTIEADIAKAEAEFGVLKAEAEAKITALRAKLSTGQSTIETVLEWPMHEIESLFNVIKNHVHITL